MLSLIIRFCSITIIFNARLVKLNSTEVTSEKEAIYVTARIVQRFPKLDLYDWDVFCKFQANKHDCALDGVGSSRYYYDTKLEDCTKFVFGGCPTNQKNIFNSQKECTQTCREPGKQVLQKQDFFPNVYCRFQPDFGTCHDYNPMFYFDVGLRKCVGFSFSGCGGNQNRFKTHEECQRICYNAVNAYSLDDDMIEDRYRV